MGGMDLQAGSCRQGACRQGSAGRELQARSCKQGTAGRELQTVQLAGRELSGIVCFQFSCIGLQYVLASKALSGPRCGKPQQRQSLRRDLRCHHQMLHFVAGDSGVGASARQLESRPFLLQLLLKCTCIDRGLQKLGNLALPGFQDQPRMWYIPELMALFESAREITCTMCAFGTPYMKPTRLWIWNAVSVPKSPACVKCSRRKLPGQRKYVCGFTGQRHLELSGISPSGKKQFKTKTAEEYPQLFAEWALGLLRSQCE